LIGMEIDGKTGIYGLIGHPVAHSLSPLIQNAAFRACDLNAVYVTFDVEDLPRAVDGIRGLNLKGVNVTLPWKHEILPLLDEISETGRISRAVNTVANRGKRLIGTNTDVTGLLRLFREKGFNWRDKPVIVLGAGGAARAVVTALKSIGAKPSIYNRNLDRHLAVTLSRDLDCPFHPLESITIPEGTAAVINCTPVGMAPDTEALPLPVSLLQKDLVVMDAVYAPVHTRLLREAEKVGCRVISGTEWLVAQGADSFRFWTGLEPPENIMRKTLLEWIKHHES